MCEYARTLYGYVFDHIGGVFFERVVGCLWSREAVSGAYRAFLVGVSWRCAVGRVLLGLLAGSG